MTSLHGEGGEVVDVTIEAVRDRFHTLNVPMAFFDGPAGTQCPDSVIEAVSGYLLTANANSGGKFLTSMVTDDVIGAARAAASDLLGVMTDEVVFGPNMTTLTFHLSRSIAATMAPGDEIVVTASAATSPVAPRRRGQGHDGQVRGDRRRMPVDLDHLQSLLEPHAGGRVPWYSNAVGTIVPVKEEVDLPPSARAPWCDAVHYAPHGIRSRTPGSTCCSARLTSSGPHLGSPGRANCSKAGARTGAPFGDAPGPPRDKNAPAQLICGFIATVEYLHGSVGRSSPSTSTGSASASSTACPTGGSCGPPTMDRVSTFTLTRRTGRRNAAMRLGIAGFAVWHGNYCAAEVFKHLGSPTGQFARHRPHEHGGRVDRPAALPASR